MCLLARSYLLSLCSHWTTHQTPQIHVNNCLISNSCDMPMSGNIKCMIRQYF